MDRSHILDTAKEYITGIEDLRFEEEWVAQNVA